MQSVALHLANFTQLMEAVLKVLKIFMLTGFALAAGITIICCLMLDLIKRAVFEKAL